MVRSPGEDRARRLRMCPHFAESALAPTIATVRGAKRASSDAPAGEPADVSGDP
jgi:hypothetical protein